MPLQLHKNWAKHIILFYYYNPLMIGSSIINSYTTISILTTSCITPTWAFSIPTNYKTGFGQWHHHYHHYQQDERVLTTFTTTTSNTRRLFMTTSSSSLSSSSLNIQNMTLTTNNNNNSDNNNNDNHNHKQNNLHLPLSSRILDTLDPCVVLMKEMIGQYSSLWENKGGIFSLAQGVVYWEPPFTCQEALLQQAVSSSSTDTNNLLHTYGPAQGIPELTSTLQSKIQQENGLRNHNIMVTVGANQAYVNCVLTILEEGSKAVVFAPYYFNHVMALQMSCGNDCVVVGPCTNQGYPNVDWLKQTLANHNNSNNNNNNNSPNNNKIQMVTIVNPGNPTGVSLPKEYLQDIVQLCKQYNVWLVLDCTYEYFTTDPNHQPIATFGDNTDNDDNDHVIYIFSFSKSYSMAGYRCGYIVTHNHHESTLYSNMLKVQDTIPIGPPRISQILALGALKAGTEWVRNQYATLDSSRQAILQALHPLPTMGGSGAMYIMAQLPPIPTTQNSKDNDDTDDTDTTKDMPSTTTATVRTTMDDVQFCRQLVQDYGIAIIPGTFCGFPGWIRVCYANLTPQKCQQAAKRLQEGIQTLCVISNK